jgi:hypothetical protein
MSSKCKQYSNERAGKTESSSLCNVAGPLRVPNSTAVNWNKSLCIGNSVLLREALSLGRNYNLRDMGRM